MVPEDWIIRNLAPGYGERLGPAATLLKDFTPPQAQLSSRNGLIYF